MEYSAPQSEIYIKWILIVHALLNKFTSGIQISNSVIIKLNNLLNSCCFTIEKHTPPYRNIKQFNSVSGKK
jgi:hypothetical protein